jgi:chondroitin AC lyase
MTFMNLKSFHLLLFFYVLFALFPFKAKSSSTLQKIKKNIIFDIMTRVPKGEGKQWKREKLSKQAELFDHTLGQYKDLNYVDGNNSTWGPAQELSRNLDFSIAYYLKGHPFYQSPNVLKIIQNSATRWEKENYLNHNWWMNEIGIPSSSYRILLLLEDKLPDHTKKTILKITKQAENFSENTGQNLIWFSEIFIGLGILEKDLSKITFALKNILSTLEYSQPFQDGLQSDLTFFQHGPVFYNGGYGSDFSVDLSRMANIVDGTELAFPENKKEILLNYILDSQRWLVRGNRYNYSAVGRYYARPDYSAAKLAAACALLARLKSFRQKELKQCAQKINSQSSPLVKGNKFFWNGEFMVQQTKDFSLSVKMVSKNVLNNDTTPNWEGLMNNYLSDGVTYIMRDGQEYKNIFPIWDYRRIPGTTETQDLLVVRPDQRNFGATSFVGGLSNGDEGLAAMDFLRGELIPSPHYTIFTGMNYEISRLTAKKSWFFSQKGMVALGAGIKHTGTKESSIWTSINQTWSKGSVMYMTPGAKDIKSLEEGAIEDKILWFHHDNIAYINFEPQHFLTIQNIRQEGSWYSINQMLSKEKKEGKVFSAWISHGLDPKGSTYAYGVFPGIKSHESAKKIRHLGITILSNTPTLQAIEEDGNTMKAVFYSKGIKLKFKKILIESQSPILVMMKRKKRSLMLSVSDPTQEEEKLSLSLGGHFSCDSCQYDSKEDQTTLTLYFSDPLKRGSTKAIELKQISQN